jgi:membrane protease YdiL (CAAX protease family)
MDNSRSTISLSNLNQGEGMSQPETRERVTGASTRRLVFVWLFGGIIEWTIQYVNRWVSPFTASNNLPFEAVIGDVCAVAFFLWKWPQMFAMLKIRLRVGDAVVGVAVGYLMTNIAAAIVGKATFESDWMVTNPQRTLTFVCAVLIVPVAEEMIYRAAILASLLERTSFFWAIAITSTAATIMHDSWRVAFPGQLLLCAAYLIRRRSIVASTIAHITANALVLTPSLLVIFHMK